MRLFLCGGVAVEVDGRRLPDALFAGRQGRLMFAYLACERHRSVPREELAELLWGEALPASWTSSLSAVVSKLRRLLTEAGLDGAGALPSAFGSYRMHLPEDAWIDWEAAGAALEQAELAVHESRPEPAVAAAKVVDEIARRGFLTDDCHWVDAQREVLRDMQVRAAHVRVEAYLLTGERGRAVAVAREALALDELREASYRLLMRALAAAGERGEALRVWERCRTLLVDELGADPAPETEAVYLAILGEVAAPPVPATPSSPSLPSGVVTFLLTDIVDSTGLWERNPIAMSSALERHDQLMVDMVAAHGGVLLKAKLEGDATVSVFRRASAGALAALALRDALTNESWPDGAAPAVRMALHTGEAIERDGDYFGPALNRAARLRSLAGGGQILVSQAVAEVVRDHLPDGTALRSLGERQLRGLSRGENVFELAPLTATDDDEVAELAAVDRPPLPGVLGGRGPFVGRENELDQLATEWATALAGTARAMFIAGEPGMGKTRLAGEAARRAYEQGALVLYGRCDEELGAPYQPFAEALRALVTRLRPSRLQSVRGIEELVRLVPELTDLVPSLAAPTQANPDTERYALFDALVRLLSAVSAEVPVLVVVDDLHWAAKPTLLLLRHLLRSAEGARILIVGTYRHTDLDRTHPLAGTLADLHRDGTAERLTLRGLDTGDVTEYLSATGHDDEYLGAALSTVTSGNPFFLIEVLHHVEETGGAWDPSTLPQGVREAVGRRLSRLSDTANDALLVGAVAGSQFSLDLVERVLERDLVDAIDETCHAGLVVEEQGGRFRFNHALVRQSLLSEVASVKRIRLHQRIAVAIEADASAGGDASLADLARHYFECAWAGGAAKAVDYSRRAGEQAMARLAYEEAADLYDRALQAADIETSGARDDDKAELLLARCEALLAAGDPTAAIAVVDQLQQAARNSPRLSAWATCYAGQLAVLTHPERLDATALDVAAAAEQFARMDDADGEAKAHTVRASCLARLGRVADCEAALDKALTAARRAGDPRRVNAVLAGAPVAALWGPSPVARASGRCLDVVRVLRITTGSPLVEAIALRCQAVLEALRGRTDAARRMLGSAHRSLESLGHTHGLLETDLFSGMVELLAGDPGAAEVALRRAYDGFVARGVGVDAAQAAALLARAVLAEGRVDEAIALTEDSERLAGVDLQSAISWRAARAEALAQKASGGEALEAARAAVALADATDALIYQADAHLSLAIVLQAGGNAAECEREARRAIELYERKGATARVAVVQDLMTPAASQPAPTMSPARTRRRISPNLATAALIRAAGVFADQPFDEWAALVTDDYVEVDHPNQITTGRDGYLRTLRMFAAMDRVVQSMEPLASLGERHALVCRTRHMEGTPLDRDKEGGLVGEAETIRLEVIRADEVGRIRRLERFLHDDLHLALARLVELHAEDELPPEDHDTQRAITTQYRDRRISWSDDAVLIDHRPASLGVLEGRAAIRDAAVALRELSPDMRWRIADVLAFAPRFSLAEVVSYGTAESGGPFEISLVSLNVFDGDGCQQGAEWYQHEQIDEALARFDELVGTERVDFLENAARASVARLYAAVMTRDLESVGAMTGVDAELDDRRPVVGGRAVGRDEVVLFVRSVISAGLTDFDVTPLATRGERLILQRDLDRGRDAEAEVLSLHEVGSDGMWLGGCVFDPGDLDAAFDELDARYIAAEGGPAAAEWAAPIAAYNRRDWTTIESNLAPDFCAVDRRPASFGTLTAAEYLAAMRGLVDLAPDVRLRVIQIERLEEAGVACVLQQNGTDATGGRFEIEQFFLGVAANGQLQRLELFAPEDRVAALARYDELLAQSGTSLTNDATRRASQQMGWILAGDWEAFWAGTAIDAVAEDRRPVIGNRLEGREVVVDFARSVAAIGVTHIGVTPIATRGDRQALVHLSFRGPDGEVDVISIFEFTVDGMFLGPCVFDSDELDAAFDELDARYVAGEGAPFGDGWLTTAAVVAAYNRRDWDSFQDLLADNFAFDDHRLVGWGALDRQGFVVTIRGGVDLAPDACLRNLATIRQSPGGGVTHMRARGTLESGGEFEMEFLALGLTRDGRSVRMEFFAVDDEAAACSRFDELTATADASLTNEAARRTAELDRAFLVGDWDTWRAATAEHAVLDDRRPIVGVRFEGRDAVVGAARGVREIGVTTIDVNVIATRGERLVLRRQLFRGATGESETLVLFEYGPEGLYLGSCFFEADDLDAAFAELDARYIAGEGASFGDGWMTVFAMNAAQAARDWEALQELLAEDFVAIDHRAAGWGTLNRDDFVSTLRGLVDLAPDARTRPTAVIRHMAGAGIARIKTTGTGAGGGQFELESLVLAVIRDGLCVRQELFAVEDVGAACDRLDALTGPVVESHLTNVAVRQWSELMVCFRARDWDGFAAKLTEGAVADDRRSLVGGVRIEGREKFVALWRGIAAIGVTDVLSTVIATRGDHLLLQRSIARGDAGEGELLFVHEFDEPGMYRSGISLDPDQLDAAFREIDARYLAGEGAPFADTSATVFEFLSAYNGQDWLRCRALLADDFTVTDNRPAPAVFGAIGGPDEFIGALQPMFDLATDVRARALAIHGVSDGDAVLEIRTTASMLDGGFVELAFHVVFATRGGRIDRFEFFADDQLDVALARFDELRRDADATTSVHITNAATRRVTDLIDVLLRGDRDEFVANTTEEIVVDDRRPVVGYRAAGRDKVLAAALSVTDVGVREITTTPVATRGERLALVRNVYRGDAGESEVLNVFEFDTDGRQSSLTCFEPDDADAAFDELDARYAAGEGAVFEDQGRISSASISAVNRRDWVRLAEFFTEDFLFVDHAGTGLGELGAQEYVESVRALVDLSPDVRARIISVHRLSREGIVSDLSWIGTNTTGGAIEMARTTVVMFRGERCTRMERFPIGEVRSALARFDELVGSPAERSDDAPANSASLVMDRYWTFLCAGDLEQFLALHAEGYRLEDQRSGIRVEISDLPAVEAQGRLLIEFLGGRSPEGSVLATRGDLLALADFTLRGSSGVGGDAEVSFLGVIQVDDRRHLCCAALFDVDDLPVARHELDVKYRATLTTDEAAAWTAAVNLVDRYNGRDFAGIRQLLTDDCVVVDERVTGWGTIDADTFVQSLHQLVEMDVEPFLMSTVVHRAEAHGFAGQMKVVGSLPEGGPFELVFECAGVVHDGQFERLELLPPGQVDEAIRRLASGGRFEP